MGEILWGLVTEAESLVKKCNNLSVLYFILYSFSSIKSKWILLKCFEAAGSLLTTIAAGRPFFKSYKITVISFESLGKNKPGKKTWTNKRIFKQVLQWKAIFLHWFMWSMNKTKGGKKRTLHGKRIIQYELTLGFLQTLKLNIKFSI